MGLDPRHFILRIEYFINLVMERFQLFYERIDQRGAFRADFDNFMGFNAVFTSIWYKDIIGVVLDIAASAVMTAIIGGAVGWMMGSRKNA